MYSACFKYANRRQKGIQNPMTSDIHHRQMLPIRPEYLTKLHQKHEYEHLDCIHFHPPFSQFPYSPAIPDISSISN